MSGWRRNKKYHLYKVTTETTLYTAVAGDKAIAAIFNIEHIMQIKAVPLVQLTDVLVRQSADNFLITLPPLTNT